MKPKSTLRHFLALAGSSILAISSSHAADGTWNVDADGLWSVAGNWTPGIATGSGFTANFNNDITADRTVSLDGATGDRTLTSVVFGDSETATAGSWILNNGGVSTNNLILAGITVNALGAGKTATISAVIQGTVGLVKSGVGTLVLSGVNTYTGTTTVDGGELQWGITDATATSALTVNNGGTVNIQGFSDSVGAVTIAKGGTITGTTGTLTSNGLTSNNGGSINSFTTGGLILSGSNLNLTYNDTISGSTTLSIDRVDIRNTVTFNIARGDDASGVDFDITSLIYSNNNGRSLIKSGSGVMRLSGNTASPNGGATGLSNGAISIQDGTLIFNKSAEVAAFGGSGLITIGDGTGSAASAVLQYKTSSNQLVSNAITINSDGRFDLNGFSETTSGAVTNNGSITTGAGTLILGANTFSGASTATGNLIFTGTTATALTIGGTASINATTTLFGANNATGITATGTTSIAGTLALGTANNRAIAVTGATDQLTVSAQLTGGTGRTLTKSGDGILALSGDNTGFAAAISVTAGTLLVNNTTGTGTGSGTVTVGALGTLGGSGTIAGAVTVDGALKPGNSPGLLTVGSLDLNASASTTLEINGTNRGALTDGYDALNVTPAGSIDLAGALIFEFGNLAAFTNGTDFDLFSFDTTSTGDFAGVTSTGFYAGTWGKTSDIWSLDSGGQTLNFSEVTGNLSLVAAIPEPRAALLGGLGLLMLLRRRR